MTNYEKYELRKLCKEGYSFSEIRSFVSCSDATIKNYLKIFKKEAKRER
jgi:hypothetical protein